MSLKRILSVVAIAATMIVGGCSSDPEEPEYVKPDEEEPAPDPDPEPEPEPDPEPEFLFEYMAGQLFITTENNQSITSKEDYIPCTVTLRHENEEWNLDEAEGGIRGRGNSSWEWYPKKPYRIKFDKKQPMLGLDEAKSWVLLAEYRDPTDLMNAFVFELGQLAELPFTNHNRYVEVTLNDKYIGLYHLTEQVQQNKYRVNIDEKEGYLLELDRDDGPELAPHATDNFWSEIYGMPVCVKNPDEPTSEILESAKKELAVLEKAIKDSDWDEINNLLDVRTMIDYLIIQELVYNVELDAPRSMYIHKDVEKRWAMGPLWDFDAGFDFDWSTMYTGHTYFRDYTELVMGTNPATHAGTIYRVPGFFSDLFKIEEFKEQYKERWYEVSELVTLAWDITYNYYAANTDQFRMEYQCWPIDKNYGTEINKLKNWITNRVNYLNTIIPKY